MITIKHLMVITALMITGALVADHMKPETIDKRTAPIGQVKVKASVAATSSEPAAPRTAQTIVETHCIACHGAGMPGAAKIGDKEAWAAKLAPGKEAVLARAISGINAMPARGTCMNCSDDELWSAIEYMANYEK